MSSRPFSVGNILTVIRTGLAVGERSDGSEFDVDLGSRWEVSEVDRLRGSIRHALLTNDSGDTVSLSGPEKLLTPYVSHSPRPLTTTKES